MIKCSIKVYFNYFFIENSWKATRNIKKLTHCKRVFPGISLAKLSNQNIALLFWTILEIPLTVNWKIFTHSLPLRGTSFFFFVLKMDL